VGGCVYTGSKKISALNVIVYSKTLNRANLKTRVYNRIFITLIVVTPAGWTARVQLPAQGRILITSTTPRPSLGAHIFPIQWIPGGLYPLVNLPGLCSYSPLFPPEIVNV
jgi:hypothetical protein